ncbi:MAG: ABC transporter ATP-binding protein [Coriobacteriales bacterium]|jgi:putative ABC transport system ATP-binding protein|nr:ABC transporter ATP-binding protein [Coriobacteriales bacterium]
MTILATLQNVTKVYQTGELETAAVKDASFIVERGDVCVIIGSSGSGKTTILNILGGITRCTSGVITVDGRAISEMDDAELTNYRRHEVGYVFQFYNLVQNLTALENVELATELCKDVLEPKQVLEAVGLHDRMHNFPSQLSGGEQQRVAIARALAKKPKLLLCDEPTGALDDTTGLQVLRLLQQASHSFDVTVVLVTHNTAIVEMAHRVITVRNGGIANIAVNTSPTAAEYLVL